MESLYCAFVERRLNVGQEEELNALMTQLTSEKGVLEESMTLLKADHDSSLQTVAEMNANLNELKSKMSSANDEMRQLLEEKSNIEKQLGVVKEEGHAKR